MNVLSLLGTYECEQGSGIRAGCCVTHACIRSGCVDVWMWGIFGDLGRLGTGRWDAMGWIEIRMELLVWGEVR